MILKYIFGNSVDCKHFCTLKIMKFVENIPKIKLNPLLAVYRILIENVSSNLCALCKALVTQSY